MFLHYIVKLFQSEMQLHNNHHVKTKKKKKKK